MHCSALATYSPTQPHSPPTHHTLYVSASAPMVRPWKDPVNDTMSVAASRAVAAL